MDNATRRQLLEQAKQVGYTGSILDVFQNPQVLDQFVQEQQQVQQQPQQQSQPQMQVEMPTPPATTPNYRVPQPKQSEAQPLVMSNTEVPIQIRKTGGILYENGGPKDKGWREYKTPTGESLYLDPRFKDQRYYVNEKGDHVTPDQNMSLFDVKDNIWESGTSLPTLKVNDVSHLNKEDAQIINKITKQQQWAKNATGVAEPTFSPIDAAIMLAASPLTTIPSMSSILSAPLVVGGSTVPGVTVGSTIGAGFGGYGVTKLPNTYNVVNKAYNNPTTSNITDAFKTVGLNALDFVGLGIGKAAISGANNLRKYLAIESPMISKTLPNSVNTGSITNTAKNFTRDASGFINRRQFLKQLQEEGLIGKEFGFDDLNYAARSVEKTNALTRLALERDATVFRGVQGSVQGELGFGKGYKSYGSVDDIYDMTRPRFGNISEIDNMIKAGVNFDDPLSIAHYQATHIPMNTYGYRSGMLTHADVDALYAGAEPTGYGNYMIKMKLPRNYDKGDYLDWYVDYGPSKINYNNLPKNTNEDFFKAVSRTVNESSPGRPLTLGNTRTTVIGQRGKKMYDVDTEYPFSDYKNLDKTQQKLYEEFIEQYKKQHATGWRGEFKTGGKKCYTCNSSKLKVLYNKANYKK